MSKLKTKKFLENEVVESLGLETLALYLICIYHLKFGGKIHAPYLIYWESLSKLIGRLDSLTDAEEEELREHMRKHDFSFATFGYDQTMNGYYLVGTISNFYGTRYVEHELIADFVPEKMKSIRWGLDEKNRRLL